MLLQDVVEASQQVRQTRSRTRKSTLLSQVLRAAADESIEQVTLVASYLSGVVPQRRLGVGWRGLAEPPAPAPAPTLTVTEVDATFTELATAGGSGSAARRAAAVHRLMAGATAPEQGWLRDLITGEVRQGALDGVLQQAVATAADVPVEAVRRAAMLAGHTSFVARAALTGGQEALTAIRLQVGRPVRPMLAASAPDIAEAMAPARAVRVESKLDGIRIQVHIDGAQVGIFTRSLEEVTERLPEIVEHAAALGIDTAVLDGEAIALAPDGRPRPFQVTAARTASSTDPALGRDTVPLTAFYFDVLHLDGRDLHDEPAAHRWETLEWLLPIGQLVPRLVTAEVTEAQEFFADRVAAGYEGVVIKDLQAPYAAGRRGAGWLKVKPRHTLDLVVLAVEWGSGRRRGRLSNIHLGARSGDGAFVMVGKTFKGMTDEMLAWQTERFLQLETRRRGHEVHVRPEQVVEVAVDGVQASPRYPGGVALRFARVLRYREDKSPEEADTIDTVQALAGG